MCMLIHHPAGAEPFSRSDFADFHRKSPHGFGVIWRSPLGEIRSRRGLLGIDETWPLYRTLYANGCHEMVLHWRFRTAGPVNDENCHPFVVPGTGLLMMHNGPNIGPSTDTKSDSAVFAEKLGNLISERGRHLTIDDPNWLEKFKRRIGGDKLTLWHRNDPFPLLVGGPWTEWRGRLYSNTYAWTVPDAARPRRAKFDWHTAYA